jgi:endonuclease/exonuclease/phosphatase family metal-dependent hydrolase
MTYNVHRCAGPSGNDSIAEIKSVCRDADADLIALQELDAPETDEEEGAHHARDLAASLGMQLLFCRTFRRSVGYYGHALLCRHKLELRKATTFASSQLDAEPRGAIWARATLPSGVTIDIISTHLGVNRNERAMQSEELVGHEWLASERIKGPYLLCGDLNAVPYATTYRRFAAKLRDAQRALPRHRPRATFPSVLPVLRLDHVFVSPELEVRAIDVPWNARSRRASDHLPLIIELELCQRGQQP